MAVRNAESIPDSGKNVLHWGRIPIAEQFTIYKATTPGVTEISSAITIDSFTTSYTDDNLTNGTTCYYRIQSTDAFGNTSNLSEEISSTPAVFAPPLVRVRNGDGQVILTWTYISVATKYKIFWDTTSGVTEYSDSILIDTNITAYTHSGLINSRSYFYRMASVNAAGESSVLSREIHAWPDSISIPDEAPKNIVTTVGVNQIILTWNPITDTSQFVLYWDTLPWVTQWASQRIDSVSSPYTHVGLKPTTPHYYRVALKVGQRKYLAEEVSAIPTR